MARKATKASKATTVTAGIRGGKTAASEDLNRALESSSVAETGRLNMTALARDLLGGLVRMGPITPICLPQCRVLTEPPFEEHAPDCEYAALVNRATEALS